MAFARQNSVQKKIGCVFEIKVEPKESSKRPNQTFQVSASDHLNSNIIEKDLEASRPTEKIDGTCCYIADFEGKPWLWARHDRKPNKLGDKKLRKYKSQKDAWRCGGEVGDRPTIAWAVANEFKDVPSRWIPALEVEVIDGIAQPDDHGHIPGWVPVDPKERQHMWHQTTVDLNQGLALVLREDSENGGLSINCEKLSDLLEQTVEVIGTNVNGNPYHLGSKEKPVHLLVIHGSITARPPQPLTRDSIVDWLENTEEGRLEGIVWHCPSSSLFKLHRHHVGLQWPVENPRLSQQKVTVNVDGTTFNLEQALADNKLLFYLLASHFRESRDHLHQIGEFIYSVPEARGDARAAQFLRNNWHYIAGAAAAPFVVTGGLAIMGFGAGGIAAGSIAARLMSAAAIANGGGVAAGSFVAVCQSIGAVGLTLGQGIAASSIGVGVAGIARGIGSFFRRRNQE